jgi:acyl-CoA synthetase (AMP-forming)/AMP-acid ligase II
MEIWGALLNGGKLAVYEGEQASLKELGEAIHKHGVTTLWLTAGLFHLMVEERVENLRGLRQLLAGGDVLAVEAVKKVLKELPECRMINGYGPTEGTTFTCCEGMGGDAEEGEGRRRREVEELEKRGRVSIGKPIANTKVYVLDEEMGMAPVGVRGELYVGGDGVARGYLKQPELTAEKFVPSPFAEEEGRGIRGERLYRTGDQVKWLEDGRIEFLGRTDQQIKIRGFRIELGEIEAVLKEHEEVKESVVVVREATAGEKQLVAYVVGKNAGGQKTELEESGERLSGVELKKYLQGRLPEYMVPSWVVVLEEMPLTANGKIDRTALPEAAESGDSLDAIEPTTELEKLIAEHWCDVLQINSVSLTSNFFDLGGHSLLLVKLHNKLVQALGRDIPIVQLFRYTTIQSQAVYLANPEQTSAQTAVPENPKRGSDRLKKQRENLKRTAKANQ